MISEKLLVIKQMPPPERYLYIRNPSNLSLFNFLKCNIAAAFDRKPLKT